jgi:predicted transglutaminase-like cysteine proteinase
MSSAAHRISARRAGPIAASLVACAILSAPTHAAEPAVAAPSFAKSEAILGGSSKLAEILGQQGSRPVPAALAPASRGVPLSVEPLRLPLRFAARSDMPDVFGSVALRVHHTSLDRKWRSVAGDGVSGASAEFARTLSDLPEIQRLVAVNRYVNSRVSFVDDSRQFGRADLWLDASATLKRGKGDCEDYAIAKMQMLRKAGISERDLYLVIVKDLVRRADHAVLVARAGGRLLLLDNGTDAVTDAELASDYRPVLTFAQSGTWTHGFRKLGPPIQLASADVRTMAPAADIR